MLMRSVAPSPRDVGGFYFDCDGGKQPASDGFLRKAYFTTVALRNRGGFAGTAP
jgi:hypothetical protein